MALFKEIDRTMKKSFIDLKGTFEINLIKNYLVNDSKNCH